MRISDWSSDVCSSDLRKRAPAHESERSSAAAPAAARPDRRAAWPATGLGRRDRDSLLPPSRSGDRNGYDGCSSSARNSGKAAPDRHRCRPPPRSEEHTSELQSLMRISYAVFCLKKKIKTKHKTNIKST